MNRLKEVYKKTPEWMKNKYFLSGFVFCVWIAFFDTHSVKNQIKKSQHIKKIEQDINYYNKEIQTDLDIIKTLSQDTLSQELEKYFRQEMFLSKKNEEIFIIE